MAFQRIQDPAVPFGSVVVVSGVNGFIASHVADQTLAAGFKVRGTTRSIGKNSWIQEHFRNLYGPDSFELVEVKDMRAEGAFDEAVKGASGFIHVASDMSMSTDPNVVIKNSISGTVNALISSAKEPSIKRFVYTSSSTATLLPKLDTKITINQDTWNDEAVELAWKEDAAPFTVYAASKTESERAVWKWVEEHKPGFVVNTVLPSVNIGSPISPTHQGFPTTAGWVQAAFYGKYDAIKWIPAQHFVNVQDTGRLHVIALASPNVKSERIFGLTGPFNWNDVVAVLRKLYPQRKWDDVPDQRQDLTEVEPTKRTQALLKEAYGLSLADLEESVKQNTKDLQ